VRNLPPHTLLTALHYRNRTQRNSMIASKWVTSISLLFPALVQCLTSKRWTIPSKPFICPTRSWAIAACSRAYSQGWNPCGCYWSISKFTIIITLNSPLSVYSIKSYIYQNLGLLNGCYSWVYISRLQETFWFSTLEILPFVPSVGCCAYPHAPEIPPCVYSQRLVLDPTRPFGLLQWSNHAQNI
jgi:hypothetical protein